MDPATLLKMIQDKKKEEEKVEEDSGANIDNPILLNAPANIPPLVIDGTFDQIRKWSITTFTGKHIINVNKDILHR